MTDIGAAVPQTERKLMALGEAPVLETIAAMNIASLERTELAPAVLIAIRVGALAASDAPPASYLAHIGPAADAGFGIEEVQDVLVAVAPIIGSARTMTAARNITEALGFAIAVEAAIEAELEEELNDDGL